MKPTTERVYHKIRELAGTGSIKISHAELARECQLSIRTVIRHIAILENGLHLVTVQRAAVNSRVRNTYALQNSHPCVTNWQSVDSDRDSLSPETSLESLDSDSIESNQPCDKMADEDGAPLPALPGLAPSTRQSWIHRFGLEPVQQALQQALDRGGGPGLVFNFLTGRQQPYPLKPQPVALTWGQRQQHPPDYLNGPYAAWVDH